LLVVDATQQRFVVVFLGELVRLFNQSPGRSRITQAVEYPRCPPERPAPFCYRQCGQRLGNVGQQRLHLLRQFGTGIDAVLRIVGLIDQCRRPPSVANTSSAEIMSLGVPAEDCGNDRLDRVGEGAVMFLVVAMTQQERGLLQSFQLAVGRFDQPL
jgi:hypothetical protein